MLVLASQQTISSSAEDLPATSASKEVVINGSLTDVEARRDFVAGKIIIGRKRIEDSGLQNVAELLKREPVVTVGKDGRIGLLGLPGYTQVLVDGMPPTAGKELSELDLVRVEKIEIIKSAVAEFGPFGIAGTINVVTRKIERKKAEQLRAGASSVGGKLGADLAWSLNQSETDSPLSFNTQVSAYRQSSSNENQQRQTITRAGLTTQSDDANVVAYNRNSDLSVSSAIEWKADARNTINFSPGISDTYFDQGSVEHKNYADGKTRDWQQRTAGPFVFLGLPLNWTYIPNDESQLTLNWNSNRIRSRSEMSQTESSSQQTTTLRQRTENRRIDADFLRVNYKIALPNDHDVKAGGHIGYGRNSSEFSNQINGTPDTSLDALGTRRDMRQDQRRLFMQDDWRLNKEFALNFGFSFEERVIDITEGNFHSETRYDLFSPSIHLARKIDGDESRQFRISLARTYKTPSPDQLSLRPTINPLAMCAASGVCGTNSIETADTAGNPRLQPERALGLNVSYEHGIGADSQLSVELYSRAIDRLIGTDLMLENVSWSNTQRYVARPSNLGRVTVQGVDLEVQLSMRDVWPDAPKLDVRSSLGFARSQISSLPGPDNRLADQSPYRAKLGLTYESKELPLKLNTDVNWTPGDWVRTNLSQRIFYANKINVSASASWKFSSNTKLFINLDNLLNKTSTRVDEYIANDELIRLQTNKTTPAKIGVRLEVKL
ncbi:TonB-dependent receptor plug domain-containing protein [Undibacterium sp. RuTC16W]|uniref:TonB-dependent receptor plug domain-containing protein n=1 Tax=Undibacterium sp. RuTC16W TaxID=3413048 RepID=UPI003BF12A77